MSLDTRLDAAAADGLIDARQAEALKAYLAPHTAPEDSQDPAAPNDVEGVRFARGFHDVFLTIGIVLLLIGATFTAGLAMGVYGALAGAGLAWALAEVYAARRRLVLPSIALAAGFTLLCGIGLGTFITALIEAGEGAVLAYTDLEDLDLSETRVALAVSASALLAAVVFYRRFRLPFAVGLIAIAAAFVLGALVHAALPDRAEDALLPVLLIAGITIFCGAMMFDTRDPARNTLDADKAFWLHLVAAPLVVHSVNELVSSGGNGGLTDTQALVIIGIVAVLALVALIIDRRAMLVSGLIYLGIAIGQVVGAADLDDSVTIPLTLLLLGAAVVLLGTGWRTARRAVVRGFVPASWARSLPPLTSAAA